MVCERWRFDGLGGEGGGRGVEMSWVKGGGGVRIDWVRMGGGKRLSWILMVRL